MKHDAKRSNSLPEISFLVLLVANNFVAFYFLSLPFIIGIEPPFHKYSTTEVYLRLTLYGFIVSLFFSLISLAVSYLFKRYFIRKLTGQLKFFLLQLSFLFIAYAVLFFALFIFPGLQS